MSRYIHQFKQAIEAANLPPPAQVHDDGKLHRFSTNGRRNDDAGWYVLHGNHIPVGCFGDWRSGYSENWCAKAECELSQTERQTLRARIRAAHAMREAAQVTRHGEMASAALAHWESYQPATEHQYLTVKGIRPYRARTDGLHLVIPMRDTSGKLHSLQTIDTKGNKRFMAGGRVRGCYFAIGRPNGYLIVCEGFATGASIYEATGHAVAVAFNAGNLEPVAVALHAKYPDWRITIAADDDYRTNGNPGRTCAKAAALAVGGNVALPLFSAHRPNKATDFNDLHVLEGLDAVRRCFVEAGRL